MTNLLTFTQFLAIAGLLPLSVYAAVQCYESKASVTPVIRALIDDEVHNDTKEAASRLILFGIFIGVAPDVLVLLEPQYPSLVKIDRFLDMLTAPLLITALILNQASTSAHPRRAVILWLSGVAGSILFALLFVALG